MFATRLAIALETGALTLPSEGRIVVLGPRASDSLADLPSERTTVIQRHFSDHHHFARLGFRTLSKIKGDFALAIVVLPRARAEAHQAIALAAQAAGGNLVVDGQKTDGIASVLKSLGGNAKFAGTISKAHGKLAVMSDVRVPEKVNTTHSLPVAGRFVTEPGVFSADGVDPASEFLVSNLPGSLRGNVADLGAGWGYLSHEILSSDLVRHLDLVESDFIALEAARQNIGDSRASFHWADATTFQAKAPYDHIITNPPFHSGRRAEPALGIAFINSAARLLSRNGSLWLVANQHLPYEKTLKDAFNTVQPLAKNSSFKVFQAKSPKNPHKGS